MKKRVSIFPADQKQDGLSSVLTFLNSIGCEFKIESNKNPSGVVTSRYVLSFDDRIKKQVENALIENNVKYAWVSDADRGEFLTTVERDMDFEIADVKDDYLKQVTELMTKRDEAIKQIRKKYKELREGGD